MIRTYSHPKSLTFHTSRPFFSKASTGRTTAPFFSVQRSDVVQRIAETSQLPEEKEEEPLVQTKSTDETLQREMIPNEEEEEIAQPKVLTATPIQRMCTERGKEQQEMSMLQPKLTVGQPGDKYEQEADRVADQVVNRLQTPNNSSIQTKVESDHPRITPLVMRQGERSAAITPQVEQGIQHTRGGGQAIAQPIRRSMEQAFGADFSRVRIHENGEADQLNRSLNAQAFTAEQDIYFKEGKYQPDTQGGQKLLAHELTHVVQQSQSLTDPTLQRQPNLPKLATELSHDIELNLYNYRHHFYRIATLHPDQPKLLENAFARYALGLNVLETSYSSLLGARPSTATAMALVNGITYKGLNFLDTGELVLDYQIDLGNNLKLETGIDLKVNPADVTDIRGVNAAISLIGSF